MRCCWVKWDAFDGQASEICGRSDALRRQAVHASSVRSTFRGTGRGWSTSTTDIRAHSPSGGWAVEEGRVYRYKKGLRLRAGEANVGIMNAPGEIAESSWS